MVKITGKGSASEVKPGVYKYYYSLGKDPETGKYRKSPKRTLHCVSKNKRGREAELRKAMEVYREELETGITPEKYTNDTVGEYADLFHELRKGALGSELSWKREALDVEHIKELFGPVKLSELRPHHVKRAYADAREKGRYSENELHKIHAKLSQIMKEAVDEGFLLKNPCSSIKVPRPAPRERSALSIQEASRLQSTLLEQIEELLSSGDVIRSGQALPHLIGTLTLLDTGMRRGEMLGLDWEHVDLESGVVFVELQFANDKKLRAPKSPKSKRYLKVGGSLLSVLNEWKDLQGRYFSAILKSQSANSPVVNNDWGGNMDPNNYSRWFRDWCVKNEFGERTDEPKEFRDANGQKRWSKTGYVGLTPHMLRHTQATLLIGANTDIKTVQSRLGHSSANLTMDIYAHAIAEKDALAAETIESLLTK